MAAIRVRDSRENPWITGREYAKGRDFGKTNPETEAMLDTPVRMHEPGSDTALQLFEIDFEPGVFVDIHSHATDEIIYVVKGSLELGKRSLGPGSSVFVGADTLYSFRSGPEGLQLLNFRPHRDGVYRTREQHLAYVKEKSQATSGPSQSTATSE